MSKHPRRRASDKADDKTDDSTTTDATPTPKEPVRKRSAREFFHRFRQPLIGLGIAGAAAPLIQRQGEAEHKQITDEGEEAADTQERAGDLEDEIADRISETHARDVREDTIAYAIDRYAINRDLAEDIYDVAVKHNIEPKIAYGLVKTESAFNHRALSRVGARGLTQVMPRTARWLLPGTSATDLYRRDLNLDLGFRYLNQLVGKYDGNLELALLAYNRGPGTVDRILKRGGNPDNGYARKVMDG